MAEPFKTAKSPWQKRLTKKPRFTVKYGREIYVCAKSGGIDPNGNLSYVL